MILRFYPWYKPALQDDEKNIPQENKFVLDMEEDSFTKKRRGVRVWEQSDKNTEVEVEVEVELVREWSAVTKSIYVMSCHVM